MGIGQRAALDGHAGRRGWAGRLDADNRIHRFRDNQGDQGNYRPSFMKSLTCSPITIVVTLVLARTQSGIMEASTTLSPVTP